MPWSLAIKLVCLASKTQGSSCLCLLSTGITNIHQQNQHFDMGLGTRTQVFMQDKGFTG